MKHILILLASALLFITCDTKKTSISGKVINSLTGESINNALVNYVQCEQEGENCNEIVIAQVNTNSSGEFIIEKKTASKSKKKWLDVYVDNTLVGHKDNIGLKDKNIVIEVTL